MRILITMMGAVRYDRPYSVERVVLFQLYYRPENLVKHLVITRLDAVKVLGARHLADAPR